ncbi:hypothetical protein P7K49_004501, partial [Saguinus oedipus]
MRGFEKVESLQRSPFSGSPTLFYFQSITCHPRTSTICGFRENPPCVENVFQSGFEEK